MAAAMCKTTWRASLMRVLDGYYLAIYPDAISAHPLFCFSEKEPHISIHYAVF